MLHPKVVLAPTDFSEPATDATETAASIASKYGAVLLLVHVVPALPKLPATVSLFHDGEYEKQLRADAVVRMAELTNTHARNGLSVRSEVGVANDVGMEIVRISEHQGADLIVIATHGMTGWNTFVFGSVAEKVMRLSSCAVLVTKPPQAAKQAGKSR